VKRLPIFVGLAMVALCLLGLSSAATQLGPGALDRAYGKRGLVIRKGALWWAMALAPNGKLVVAGPGGLGFTIGRYNANGSPDRSFGHRGVVRTKLTPDPRASDLPFAVAVQPDGKVIAAGSADDAAFALVRYRKDGSLDSTFGSEGKVLTRFGGHGAAAFGLALRRNGKIVAVGEASNGLRYEVALAQYNPDGSLDQKFGTGGTVMTALCGTRGDDDASARGVALQYGKIVVAGSVYYDGDSLCLGHSRSGGWMAILRYRRDGTPDQGFGTHGQVFPHFGTYAQSDAIALAPGHRIVVGGSTDRFALVRLNLNGTLDRHFGHDGNVAIAPRKNLSSSIAAVAVTADRKVIAAGTVDTSDGFDTNGSALTLARFRPNGRPDRTFGARGVVVTQIASWPWAFAGGMGLRPNGEIDVAGSLNKGSIDGPVGPDAWVLARYFDRICAVPSVRGRSKSSARAHIRRADCALGRVSRAFSPTVRTGHVITQRPPAGRRLRPGAKVNLVVSKGERR
jgi:uncharacterized delta-60 repeat protein